MPRECRSHLRPCDAACLLLVLCRYWPLDTVDAEYGVPPPFNFD
jgi:hypothetical protein